MDATANNLRGPGNPNFKPFRATATQRCRVAVRVLYGETYDQIADGLRISRQTLCKYFKQELTAANEKLVRLISARVASKGLKGNLSACMFWMKCQGGPDLKPAKGLRLPRRDKGRATGRPSLDPTPEQRLLVAQLRYRGDTQAQIAAVLQISTMTLRKCFKSELHNPSGYLVRSIIGTVASRALAGHLPSGFFFLKCRGGWRENAYLSKSSSSPKVTFEWVDDTSALTGDSKKPKKRRPAVPPDSLPSPKVTYEWVDDNSEPQAVPAKRTPTR